MFWGPGDLKASLKNSIAITCQFIVIERFFFFESEFFNNQFLFFIISRGEYYVFSSYSDTLPPDVQPRLWKKQKFHYDTVPTAMLTLFAVQTTEGWPMYV